MDKIFTHKRSLLTQVAFLASYGSVSSVYLSLFVELFSTMQVLYLILETSFPQSDNNKAIIFTQIRDIMSFIGLLDPLTTFETEIFTLLVWVVISLYLIAYLGLMLYILLLCMRNTTPNFKLTQVCTQINAFHSKVLFCPILYFYLKTIISPRNCTSGSITCNSTMTTLSIILSVLNTLFAAIKEAFFYQAYKNKNSFAVKNNIHSLIQLAHKTLLLALLALVDYGRIGNSILNAVFTLGTQIFLILKLPYFNIRCLRIAIVLSTICSTSAFILLWKIFFATHVRTFELLLTLVVPILVRFVLGRLDVIFERILSFRATLPEYVVHLPALVREYIYRPKGVDYNEAFEYKTLFSYGLMKRTGIDVLSIYDPNQLKEYKYQINAIILQELLKCSNKNPKSTMLLLFLIQFYVEKMKNVARGIVYIQKMENLSFSAPALNILFQIRIQLQRIMFKAYSDHDSTHEFVSYFKYKEVSNDLKTLILTEVIGHIEFWRMLSKEKIDIYPVMMKSHILDFLAKRITKMWEENEQDFTKNFPVPLVMYGVYLYIVRTVPHIAHGLLDSSAGKNSKLLKSMEKWFSQERALIVASNQKGTIGKVLDASHSVKNLFNIDKQDLIGRKINLLMPSMIQEKHDALIQKYNEKPEYALELKRDLWCKTIDGRFFCASVDLRVYPYLNHGIGIMGIFNKKEDHVPVFFLDYRGSIVDCSRELLDLFQADFSLTKNITIDEIAYGFDKINEAFNAIYGPLVTASKQGLVTKPELEEQHTINSSISSPFFSPQHPRAQKKVFDFNQRSLMSEASPILPEDMDLNSGQRFLSSTRRIDLFQTMTSGREMISPMNIMNSQGVSETISESGNMKMAEEFPGSSARPQNIAAVFINHLQDHHSPPLPPRKEVPVKQPELPIIDEPDIEQCTKTCKQFTDGDLLTFHSLGPITANESKNIVYHIQVEPFIFEKELYKIVKVRPPTRRRKTDPRTPRWTPQSKRGSQLETNGGDPFAFGRRMRTGEEFIQQSKEVIERITYSEIVSSLAKKTIGDTGRNDESIEIRTSEENYEENGGQNEHKKRKKGEVNSNDKAIRIEKTLHNLVNKTTPDRITRAHPYVFYTGLLIMMALATLDFVMTKGSFQEVQLGAQLINVDSERLINLLQVWGVVNTRYSFSVRNLDIPNSLNYTDYVRDKMASVKELSGELILTLGDIDSQAIISEFYRRDISLWQSFSNETIQGLTFDVFTAINIVLQKMFTYIQEDDSGIDAEDSLAIFGLNNTANDLLLSAERELAVTQQVKETIYTNNVFLMRLLIGLQSFAIFVLNCFLVGFGTRTYKATTRIFKALSTMPLKHITTRERQLIRLRDCLQESIESFKFTQDLHSLVEEGQSEHEKANAKAVGYKENENKFYVQRVKAQFFIFIGFTIFILLLILGLFFVSNFQSLDSIDSVKALQEASSIAEKMGYNNPLISSNLMYWAIFYNYTTMLVRDQPPGGELMDDLQVLSDANSKLITAFPQQEDKFYSPDIEKMLSTDICSFIQQDQGTQDLCKIATNGNVIGLIALNRQYLDFIVSYMAVFQETPTLDTYNRIINDFLSSNAAPAGTLNNAYKYLRESLLNLLNETIEDHNLTSMIIFIAICISCLLGMFVIRSNIVFRLERMDIVRYQFLRVLPKDLMIHNKAVLFYLKKEFADDLVEVKSFL